MKIRPIDTAIITVQQDSRHTNGFEEFHFLFNCQEPSYATIVCVSIEILGRLSYPNYTQLSRDIGTCAAWPMLRCAVMTVVCVWCANSKHLKNRRVSEQDVYCQRQNSVTFCRGNGEIDNWLWKINVLTCQTYYCSISGYVPNLIWAHCLSWLVVKAEYQGAKK